MRLATVFCLISLSTYNAMSSEEAVFKCKISIENAENHYSQLENTELKKVVKIALSKMQKILKDLLHGSVLKDLPALTHQCIQHAEHVAWLKDSIESSMKTTKEQRTTLQTSTSGEKKDKSKTQTTKQKDKKIKLDQQNLDLNALEETLKDEKCLRSNTTLAPSL